MTEQKTDAPSLAPLYAALSQARDRCEVAEKSGKHHHGFAYAPSEEIFGVAREAFAGTGLTLLPLRSSIALGGSGVSEHGEALAAQRTLCRTFSLVHASGATLEVEACPWPIVGGKGRGSDTAVAIALTTQLAYLYRDLLLMRRGGDDHDSEDRGHDQRPAARPALAPRPAASAPRPAPTPAQPAASQSTAPAPGPSGSPKADSSLGATFPAGTQAARVLEAPAATPARTVAPAPSPTNGASLAGGAGPLSDRLAEDERVAIKLGDEHWELATPICDGDLAQVADREVAKSVLAVGTARLGGLPAALAAWGRLGIASRALPTRGQLRAFLLALPDSAPVEA